MSTRNRECSNWLDVYLEYTEGTPSPRILRKWSAIATVAGILERKCWVYTMNSCLYPNMFILLIAPPGVGKSIAIKSSRYFLEQLPTLSLAPTSLTHKGLIDYLASELCTKQITDEIKNTFIEYHSMIIAAPEFGVLLPSNDLPFMNCLNDLYDCDNIYHEQTRGGGGLQFPNPHIHILAGTQPKYLGEILPEAAYGLGFTSRIIMVYAGEPVKIPIFKSSIHNKTLQEQLEHDIKVINLMVGKFTPTQEAEEALENWHMIESDIDKPIHSKLQHYSTRRIAHLLKLCMTYSAIRDNTLEITYEDFTNAKNSLLEAEEYMPEIFKEIGASSQIGQIEEAFQFILTIYMKTKKPISEHKLVHFLSTRMPVNQIIFTIDTMVRARIIKVFNSKLARKGISNRLFIPGQMTLTE